MEAKATILANSYTYKFLRGLTHPFIKIFVLMFSQYIFINEYSPMNINQWIFTNEYSPMNVYQWIFTNECLPMTLTHFQIPQISYASTSLELSDKSRYCRQIRNTWTQLTFRKYFCIVDKIEIREIEGWLTSWKNFSLSPSHFLSQTSTSSLEWYTLPFKPPFSLFYIPILWQQIHKHYTLYKI